MTTVRGYGECSMSSIIQNIEMFTVDGYISVLDFNSEFIGYISYLETE